RSESAGVRYNGRESLMTIWGGGRRMSNPATVLSAARPRRMVAAMVLGTALSALGSSASATVSPKTVNDLSRYCTACWRNARLPADTWSDCTQEVFSRLVQNINPDNWSQVFQAEGDERQEFLRAIDAVKKRTQRQLKRSANLNTI